MNWLTISKRKDTPFISFVAAHDIRRVKANCNTCGTKNELFILSVAIVSNHGLNYAHRV